MANNDAFKAALGQPVALVLWGTMSNGQDDVAVYRRKLLKAANGYVLVDKTGHMVEVQSSWIPRFKAVPAEFQETVMDCAFQISVTVGNVSQGTSPKLEAMGLTWPQSIH